MAPGVSRAVATSTRRGAGGGVNTVYTNHGGLYPHTQTHAGCRGEASRRFTPVRHRRSVERWYIILLLISSIGQSIPAEDELTRQGRLALEYVERVRNSPCSGGTEEILPVDFDHAQWDTLADVALRMVNLLTKIVVQNNNKLDVSLAFLFDLVRNNVDPKTLIFGSGIAADAWVFPEYEQMCAYAYRKGGVFGHDIAVNYDYFNPATEWFWSLKLQNWSRVEFSENTITYRYNASSHDERKVLRQPLAQLDHGHWTKPYFDCGGGDIWMTTYTAPWFGIDPDTELPLFRGIGTIDIELTNIDINQCDPDLGEDGLPRDGGSVDVFRGTHHCQPTTKCVTLVGYGFIRGAYVCECMDGYYFPQLEAELKAFNGTIIEEHYAVAPNNTERLKEWICIPCAEGCETCVDDSPCLYSLLFEIRLIFTALTLVITVAIIIISIIVALNKHRKVIKSASPMFLHIMTTGAGLMCLPMFVTVTKPTDLTCTLRIWPRHIGFSLLYGALLLKTWRISNIFKVKSARRLNLSDKVLVRRFIPILCVSVGYLSAWTVIARPATVWRKTTSDLKFLDCPSDYWEYGAKAGEAMFLLWGAYLCYVVRKAPSQFNESKFITWAIYNNIILGSFIIIIKQFIAVQEGPDVMYMMDFIYLQVSVTGTMLLIFAQKMWGLRGTDTVDESEGSKKGAPATTIDEVMVDLSDKATQTEVMDEVYGANGVSMQNAGSGLLSVNNKVAPSDG